MSTRICLEIDHIKIHRPKKRWRMYFLVATDHPLEQDKMLVSILPQKPILVVPGQENQVAFEDDGEGANGLLVLARDMPKTREINVHVYVMHSRRTANEIGKVLQNIEQGIGADASGLLNDILGAGNQWLSITRKALPLIGQIMAKVPDRNMGFVSMFERFGPEFESEIEVDREVRGGHITVIYSWSLVSEALV